MNEHHRRIRSYVKRQGRMSRLQKSAYETLKSTYVLPYAPNPLDNAAVFGNLHDVVVEIGFGMGIASAEIAAGQRDVNFLGIEVHTPGVGKLLSEIERLGLGNVRIIQEDAVPVMEHMIPKESLKGIHIFFPDPWPKKKHLKRRLIQREFLQLCADNMKHGGYIYMVTDWQPYAEWIIDTLEGVPLLNNPYKGYAVPRPWRPRTRFEHKGIEKQNSIFEIYAVKKGSPD